MSYDLAVYSTSGTPPDLEEVSELLDFAGWRWLLLSDLDSMNPANLGNTSVGVGWEIDSESTHQIENALNERDRTALNDLGDYLCVVSITVDTRFELDPEILTEMIAAGLDPELVDRVKRSKMQYVFSTSANSPENSDEFQWALAGAVGVCAEGILEDIEEGSLEDCTED